MPQGTKTMELFVGNGLDGSPVDVVRYAAALHPLISVAAGRPLHAHVQTELQ